MPSSAPPASESRSGHDASRSGWTRVCDAPARERLPRPVRLCLRVLVDAPRNAIPHTYRYGTGQLAGEVASPLEQAELAKRGVEGQSAQSYLVWRRSGLLIAVVPVLVAAGFTLRDTIIRSERLANAPERFRATLAGVRMFSPQAAEGLAAFGPETIAPVTRALTAMSIVTSLFALVSAGLIFAALYCWHDYARSRRFLFWAWGVSLLRPLVYAAFPLRLLLRLIPLPEAGVEISGMTVSPEMLRVQMTQLELEFGAAAAIHAIVVTAPVVLTIFPAVIRAGLHAKRLVPESPIPGWVVLVTPPLYIICASAFFAVVNQLAGSPLLWLGISCVLVGPLAYLAGARRVVRPAPTQEIRGQVRLVRVIGIAVTLVGYVVIGSYVATLPYVVDSGVLSPLRLTELSFEFITRFLISTLVATDLVVHLLLIMQKQVWRHVNPNPELRASFKTRMAQLANIEHRASRPPEDVPSEPG